MAVQPRHEPRPPEHFDVSHGAISSTLKSVMELAVQRDLIWSGVAMLILWIGSFVFVSGFFPPSHPNSTAETIVRLYTDHTIAIKVGMVIALAGSALLVPHAIAISGQLKRIDGAWALADVQMVSCALLSLEFTTPIGIWMAASFHDIGWILFVTVIWSVWLQLIVIAAAILIDKRPTPVLARSLGYLTLWAATLIIPASLVLFFKIGPFAWYGIVGL